MVAIAVVAVDVARGCGGHKNFDRTDEPQPRRTSPAPSPTPSRAAAQAARAGPGPEPLFIPEGRVLGARPSRRRRTRYGHCFGGDPACARGADHVSRAERRTAAAAAATPRLAE